MLITTLCSGISELYKLSSEDKKELRYKARKSCAVPQNIALLIKTLELRGSHKAH